MNVWRVHVPVWMEQLVSTLTVLTSASVMQDTEFLVMARLVKVCGIIGFEVFIALKEVKFNVFASSFRYR